MILISGYDERAVARRFKEALEGFVEKVKADKNVAAVVLCGSLANDKVWEKSDMDVKVIVHGGALDTKSFAVGEDGLLINADIVTRPAFRKLLEKARGGGFESSYFSKAKIVYTTDDSLYEFLDEMRGAGKDDMEMTFFSCASSLLHGMHKIEKWLVVKDDPLYAQSYVVFTGRTLADMVLLLNGEMPTRESVLRAAELEPDFMRPFYEYPLTGRMTSAEVYETLGLLRKFLTDHMGIILRCVEKYMDSGEEKSVTELSRLYGYPSHGICEMFDFLCEEGRCAKSAKPIRITSGGRLTAEEITYAYIRDGDMEY